VLSSPCLARGWCFFEFAISTDHWRVVNYESAAVNELLIMSNAPLDPNDFAEEFAKKHFTCKGDAETVLEMYKHLYDSFVGRNDRAKCCGICNCVLIFMMTLAVMAKLAE